MLFGSTSRAWEGPARNRVIDQSFGRVFNRARFGNQAGHCTM